MSRPRKTRLVDVARDAGVSPATVSRAMAQPELLSAKTLKQVHDAAKKLGYRPDGLARALASGRSMTIGAVVPTLDSTIFARALQSMHLALAQEGYQLLVASHEMDQVVETEATRLLLSRGVDGLILVGAQHAEETMSLLHTGNVPVVLTWIGSPEFASVSVDNENAGWLAANHLLSLGHRRIGMIVGHLGFNDRQRARLAGVRKALAKAGLALPNDLISEQKLSMAGGREGSAFLLDNPDPPSAIIGGIDLFAIASIQEAQARGISVPAGLSVAGIDDIDMSATITPALTTVHIPTAEIGEMAAATLIAEIKDGRGKREICLPVALVERKSTGPNAHPHSGSS